MEKKVYVFIGIYQGIVDCVEVYKNEKDADEAFKGYTGITLGQYTEDNNLIDEDYAGSTINYSDIHE